MILIWSFYLITFILYLKLNENKLSDEELSELDDSGVKKLFDWLDSKGLKSLGKNDFLYWIINQFY